MLARLPKSHVDAVSLWKRAVAVKPDDARGWLATGDALTTDAPAARDAYQHAVALAVTPKDKRFALTKLIGAARTAGDHKTVDASYEALIALSPKNGLLWLDRGAAQLAAKQPAAALVSFATAEGLLRADPERKLTSIMNQGDAANALGKPDDAIAQYERALDAAPSGYFLAAELVTRIVDTDRRRKQVGSAIARLEKRWPERRRHHFEWAMLGDLYKETGDTTKAIDAYRHAVKAAPTEVVTQRKLIALLDQHEPEGALAQHEAAARVAPGDSDLQLELAKRYHPTKPDKALATLAALSKRQKYNVNVRTAIAALYEQWNDLPRAIFEYEGIVAAEPREVDHAIVLGDAYWRAGRQAEAFVAWQRLDAIGTPQSVFRHGEVLALHESWAPAVEAYTRALALDSANADAWYGRARAQDSLGQYVAAIDDARHAVALTANASQLDGLRNRAMLVRTLGHLHKQGTHGMLADNLVRWRFAFDHGDAAAGYLLAAHHSRIGSHQLHAVLVQLHALVPEDDSLSIALSRSYVNRREFERARKTLEAVAVRSPARAEEIAKLVARVDEDRERAERDIRWEEEGRSGGHAPGVRPDIVGRARRVGVMFEVGSDVHNTSSALLGLGAYRTWRLARGTAIVGRFDWTQRDDDMEEVNAVALGGAVTTRVLDLRKLEVAAGLGIRGELRFGSDAVESSWSRAGLAADVTLETFPRALPAKLGLRFLQNLTDSTKGSALLVELGFEVR